MGYHFVWCPKYRKPILVGKIATFIEREIRRLCAERNWTIGALNIQPDPVHLFLSAPPPVAPSGIAHQLKAATARAVFQRFPEIKNQLWGGAFWSRSCYVCRVGDMSLDVVLKYIELGQDKPDAQPLHLISVVFLVSVLQCQEDRMKHVVLLPE